MSSSVLSTIVVVCELVITLPAASQAGQESGIGPATVLSMTAAVIVGSAAQMNSLICCSIDARNECRAVRRCNIAGLQ